MSSGHPGDPWGPPTDGPPPGSGSADADYPAATMGPPAAPNYAPPGYPQQPHNAPHGYPAPYGMVMPKNPAISLLVSFFIPGVGSMINGDAGKGVGILIGYFISWLLTIVIIGFFGVIAFWVWGMVDAYSGAVNWNRRHGIVS